MGTSRDLRKISIALMIALTLFGTFVAIHAPDAEAQAAPCEPALCSSDLSISLIESADPVEPGTPVTYTFTLSNGGPDVAHSVFLAAIVQPAAAITGAAIAGDACLIASGLVYCPRPDLGVGEHVDAVITASTSEPGALFAAGSVGSAHSDPGPTNDTTAEDTTVGSGEILPPEPVTLTPTDDAFILKSHRTTNFGTQGSLETDARPLKAVLMKFDLGTIASGTVASAKLRLYNIDRSPNGGNVYASDGKAWSETSVTYSSRPRWTGAAVASFGAVEPGNWYEVDVTSLISGGEVTLFVVSPSSNGADYSSKEGAQPPQLVISFTEPG